MGQHGAEHRAEARSRRLGPRGGPGERAAHGARGRARCPARQRQLGLELVRGQDGPGVPLLQGRGHRRPPQLGVRAGLRPSRTRAPEAGAGRCRPLDPDERAPRAGAARGHRAGYRLGAVPARLLPPRAGADRARRSRTLVDAGELLPGHHHGWKRPAFLHAEAARPRTVRGPRAAEPVRPVGLRAHPHGGAVRLPLPHRDLRPRRTSGSTATTCCRSCSATGSSARVDLKADRAAGGLRVLSAWAEPDAPG